MAWKSKLTAPCGVQALATSSGVAPKVENREFYFDNIPPERSNRALPMSRHDIRTTYILGLCRLRPETFVTGFDPSGGRRVPAACRSCPLRYECTVPRYLRAPSVASVPVPSGTGRGRGRGRGQGRALENLSAERVPSHGTYIMTGVAGGGGVRWLLI